MSIYTYFADFEELPYCCEIWAIGGNNKAINQKAKAVNSLPDKDPVLLWLRSCQILFESKVSSILNQLRPTLTFFLYFYATNKNLDGG
jgi:hypothetical protein